MKRLKAAVCTLAFLFGLLASAPLIADQPSAKAPEEVKIPLNPLPYDLKGYLRRPDGQAPFPAVVLLPACDRFVKLVDQDWGQTISSWGYVTLTLDGFTPRGIVDGETCLRPVPLELAEDAYFGLKLLIGRRIVDPKRVFIVGFGRSGSLALLAVETDGIGRDAKYKFRGAVALYPSCGDVKSVAVPTLVLVGARDEQTLDACRKMANGENDMGISRDAGAGARIQVISLPDAYSGFDLPMFQKPVEVKGHHIEFSKPATDRARETLRQFLQSAQ